MASQCHRRPERPELGHRMQLSNKYGRAGALHDYPNRGNDRRDHTGSVHDDNERDGDLSHDRRI